MRHQDALREIAERTEGVVHELRWAAFEAERELSAEGRINLIFAELEQIGKMLNQASAARGLRTRSHLDLSLQEFGNAST